MNKGVVFIISGPSGSGKDTLMVELFKKRPEIKFSISSITRGMREGEVEGVKYNFISKEQFEQMIKEDKLLEYNSYVGNYYGTPKKPVMDEIGVFISWEKLLIKSLLSISVFCRCDAILLNLPAAFFNPEKNLKLSLTEYSPSFICSNACRNLSTICIGS